MEELNYKQEIESSRVGNLGSSDAQLLAQVANLGVVPKSAYRRLAICKGLIEQNNITTIEMRYGDFIENEIYWYISQKVKSIQSNPLLVSSVYSKEHVKLIAHPDYLWIDDEKQTINVYETKTTKFNVKATKETYRAQMYIEWVLAREMARKRGKKWRVNLFLVHYDTNGVDLSDGFEFDVSKLSIEKVGFNTRELFDINKAMTIIDAFLEDFNEYYDGDEVDAELLPEKIKKEFDAITATIMEIKKQEEKIDDFKKRLFDFMSDKGIKSVKNDEWAITRVDPSVSKSFDHKKYLDDYAKKYPRKYKKIIQMYTKTTNRKGYCNIKLKNK